MKIFTTLAAGLAALAAITLADMSSVEAGARSSGCRAPNGAYVRDVRYCRLLNQGQQHHREGRTVRHATQSRRVVHAEQRNRYSERREHHERSGHSAVGTRGWMPTINCDEAGGIRTINPHTGRPTCFVPD